MKPIKHEVLDKDGNWQPLEIPYPIERMKQPKPIKLPRLTCLQCGYTWTPRHERLPGTCPSCRSTIWSRPKDKK